MKTPFSKIKNTILQTIYILSCLYLTNTLINFHKTAVFIREKLFHYLRSQKL